MILGHPVQGAIKQKYGTDRWGEHGHDKEAGGSSPTELSLKPIAPHSAGDFQWVFSGSSHCVPNLILAYEIKVS